jgi:hypothetical protein
MEKNRLYFEAIALRKRIRATYNRMTVTLAPHILFTRHDELFVDAVTIERDGQKPREIKMGTFKLAGLKDVSLLDQTFQPERLFDPNDEKYAGVTLFAVDRAEADAA